MRHDLMCEFAIVLQDVVLLQLLGGSDTFAVLEDFDEVVIRDVGKLLSVILGNDERMSLRQGTDIKEGVGLLGVYQLETRDLASDDFAENAAWVGMGSHAVR